MQKLAIVASVLMLVAVAANADMMNIVGATDDTRMAPTSTAGQYSQAVNLAVIGSTSTYTYIRFDLSAVSGEITGATLNLYRNGGNATASQVADIYQVTSAWTEDDMTGATQPSYNPVSLGQITLTGGQVGWNVSSALTASVIEAQRTGNNYGYVIILPTSATGQHLLDSTEKDGGNAPYLAVEYVPEPTTLSVLGLGALALLRRRR